MSTNDSNADQKRRDYQRPNTRQKNHENTQYDQNPERFTVTKSPSEEDQRLIRSAEEKQEKPRADQAEEEEERERVRKEGKCEDYENSGKIIDAEVRVVFTDASCGIGYGFRFRESGSVDQLGKGAALGETLADGFGNTVEERAESVWRERWLRGGGYGWLLRICDWEDWRGLGGHRVDWIGFFFQSGRGNTEIGREFRAGKQAKFREVI